MVDKRPSMVDIKTELIITTTSIKNDAVIKRQVMRFSLDSEAFA